MPVQTSDQHYGLKTPYKRCPFPSPWRGLAEAELEAASGVAGASLVHQGGYVAYTSTREAALAVSTVQYSTQIRVLWFQGRLFPPPWLPFYGLLRPKTNTKKGKRKGFVLTTLLLGYIGDTDSNEL